MYFVQIFIYCNFNTGDEVLVSDVMGKGFPIEKIPPEDCTNILIFVTGSGISPIKSLINSNAFQVLI